MEMGVLVLMLVVRIDFALFLLGCYFCGVLAGCGF